MELDALLDYITANVYDYWHGFGHEIRWVIDVWPLMDKLAETNGLTQEQLGQLFDEARRRVHGPDVDSASAQRGDT